MRKSLTLMTLLILLFSLNLNAQQEFVPSNKQLAVEAVQWLSNETKAQEELLKLINRCYSNMWQSIHNTTAKKDLPPFISDKDDGPFYEYRLSNGMNISLDLSIKRVNVDIRSILINICYEHKVGTKHSIFSSVKQKNDFRMNITKNRKGLDYVSKKLSNWLTLKYITNQDLPELPVIDFNAVLQQGQLPVYLPAMPSLNYIEKEGLDALKFFLSQSSELVAYLENEIELEFKALQHTCYFRFIGNHTVHNERLDISQVKIFSQDFAANNIQININELIHAVLDSYTTLVKPQGRDLPAPEAENMPLSAEDALKRQQHFEEFIELIDEYPEVSLFLKLYIEKAILQGLYNSKGFLVTDGSPTIQLKNSLMTELEALTTQKK